MSSKYNVLPQSQAALGSEDVEGVVDLTMDDDDVATSQECRREVCAQGVSVYHNFMPIYKELCKSVDAVAVGRGLMQRGMNAIKREACNAADVLGASSGVVGVLFRGRSTRKTKAVRKQKATSPIKKPGKRRK